MDESDWRVLRHFAQREQEAPTSLTPELLRPPLVGHREVFERCHREMRAALDELDGPGVAVFAASAEQEVVGACRVRAGAGLRALVVGRHEGTDLRLPDAGGLSLRHFVVLCRVADGQVSTRVVDLATPAGTLLEGGEAVRSVASLGPLFLRVARTFFFLFPTGGRPAFRAEAERPWETLPPRAPAELVEGRPVRPREDTVTVLPDPVRLGAGHLLATGERPVGRLVVRGRGRGAAFPVGPAALRRGILLGRYERCGASHELLPETVSRVHALVLEEGDERWVVDAGSTNGTLLGDEPVGCAPLPDSEPVGLGPEACFAWIPVQ